MHVLLNTSLYLNKLDKLVVQNTAQLKTISMEAIELPCMKLLLTACMLTHATSESVGLDLFSPTSVLIPAHNKVLIDTGIAFQIPMGYYRQIVPGSSLAIHHHIHVGAGVVDPDYTGSVQVLLLNLSPQNHAIEVNHSIAQLILEKVAYPILCEVPQMLLMERGAHGFGSMGQ